MHERLPILKEESNDEFDQIIKTYREKLTQRTESEVTQNKVKNKIRSNFKKVFPDIPPPKRGALPTQTFSLVIQGNTLVPESLNYVKPVKAELSIYSQKQKDYGTLPIEPGTASRYTYNYFHRAHTSLEPQRKINLDAQVNRRFIANRKKT